MTKIICSKCKNDCPDYVSKIHLSGEFSAFTLSTFFCKHCNRYVKPAYITDGGIFNFINSMMDQNDNLPGIDSEEDDYNDIFHKTFPLAPDYEPIFEFWDEALKAPALDPDPFPEIKALREQVAEIWNW